MENIWVFTSLAVYPLYAYYIRLLTKDTKINWKYVWIILPSLILSLFSWILYFAMSPSEKTIYIHNIMYHEPYPAGSPYPFIIELQNIKHILFKIIFVIQVFLCIYFGYRNILSYNKTIQNYYSDIGGKDLTPIKWLLSVFVFAAIVSMLSAIVGKSSFIDNKLLVILPAILHSSFLFGIGYVGYEQNFNIEHFHKDIINSEQKEKTQTAESRQKSSSDIKKEILSLLEKDKIFKNPDLRISDISLIAKTNRTYISNIVNDEFKKNFADLINDYRIEYAEELLNNPKNKELSIAEISEMSGFLSESSFYRVFKNKKGISPGKYRKEIKNN
jgi:AraC-like DNA-binding protein